MTRYLGSCYRCLCCSIIRHVKKENNVCSKSYNLSIHLKPAHLRVLAARNISKIRKCCGKDSLLAGVIMVFVSEAESAKYQNNSSDLPILIKGM